MQNYVTFINVIMCFDSNLKIHAKIYFNIIIWLGTLLSEPIDFWIRIVLSKI